MPAVSPSGMVSDSSIAKRKAMRKGMRAWGYWFAILLSAIVWCVIAWLPGRAIFYIMTGR
jgi:hypothetical protein